jgi:hypothetical protein
MRRKCHRVSISLWKRRGRSSSRYRRHFPLYTLHDSEHSYRVAQNMHHLIPRKPVCASTPDN